MKLVINEAHGGFGLSEQAVRRYFEIKNEPLWVEPDTQYQSIGIIRYYRVSPEDRIPNRDEEFYSMPVEERIEYNKACAEQSFYDRDLCRADPVLVQVVEELGELADGRYATLKVVEIPDDVKWQIEEYDGSEWVAEKHRTWS